MGAPDLVEQLPTPRALLALPLLVDATLLRGVEPSGWSEWLRAAGFGTAFVGSANLSAAALLGGV